MSRRTVVSILASSAIGCVLLIPPASASAAPSACTFHPKAVAAGGGYSAAETSEPFVGSAPKEHIGVLSAFSKISAATKNQNLAEAVSINRTASAATAKYAVDDNYAIHTSTISNSLGSMLAPAFAAALRAGQLPKTARLLFGEKSIIDERTGTSAEKKHFQYRRPFEVAPQAVRHYGDGRPDLYDDVRGSGSYPSGHTTWGYSQAFLLANMFPEEGPQILYRAAEYGYHRAVLGVHYPLDVIGGRLLAQTIDAEVLADKNFSRLLREAKDEARGVLAARAGAPISAVARCQQPYVSTSMALSSYRQRSTYSFATTQKNTRIQVPAGAENLIRAAHPGLSSDRLRGILARTALPAGHLLDKSGTDGGWQRLDIARAWVTK